MSKMPGVQSDGAAVGVGSPVRKNRLSLKFLQRKETKRALDFTEPQTEDPNTAEPSETTRWENPSSCTQEERNINCKRLADYNKDVHPRFIL